MRGLTPDKYYTQEIVPKLTEIYEVLSINDKMGKSIFNEFVAMDAE